MPDTLAPAVTDVVELTRTLVRCESVTPREAGALQHLERTLAPLGFRCERMDFTEAGTDDVANLYARIGQDKFGNGKHFCFAGHSDVVPVGDLSSWTIGPFAAELSGGYLFGRGAADMKGAIAAFTEACARFLARRGRDFGGSISLLITGDEEGPAVNGTVKMLKKLAERGETIDACVVGEPTSSRRFGDMIKIGRRGSMTVDLVVRGIQGHVGYPERLDNPIHRLSALIEALVREPIDEGSTHFQPTSLQFTTIDVGNKATNIAPGTVKARFNTRFNDLWTSKTLLAHLKERMERASAARWAATARSSSPRSRCRANPSTRRPDRWSSWWPARSATSPASSRSCRPPAARRTRASSAAIARCSSSGWSARPCTRSTRRAPSRISRP